MIRKFGYGGEFAAVCEICVRENVRTGRQSRNLHMTILYSLIDERQDATLSGTTKRQLRALTRITDLFLAGSNRYSKQQIELFGEVFKILVTAIELKTRV